MINEVSLKVLSMQTWVLFSWWETKANQNQLLLSVSICVGHFLPFLPTCLDHDKSPLLLAGACSDWMEAVAQCWDQQVACRWQVMVDSSPIPFFQVNLMKNEKILGYVKKGKMCMRRRGGATKGPKDGICLRRFLLVIASALLEGELPQWKKDKQWFLSGCPSWKEQKISQTWAV